MNYIEKKINFGAGEPLQTNKLWRYTNLSKFTDLLEKKALYFARADRFEDPFEGIFPTNGSKDPIHHMTKQFYQLNRKWVCINCWHLNEFESAAMWSLYTNKNQGIAIQTTYNRFKNCFFNTNELTPQIGKENM